MANQTHRTIPSRAGAGFRTCHARDVLEGMPEVAWFEVHPENYMVSGGPRLKILQRLRADYPISFHGLALSLGGFERPDREHLKALKSLIERFEPGLVSEHLAWSALEGAYFADLLPVPYTRGALQILIRNISEVQEFLGRPILIENPAQYLQLPEQDMDETEFIMAAAQRTGCGLLFDVNNLYVSQQNLGIDAGRYVESLDIDLIGEIHLAGFGIDHFRGADILIDSHSDLVSKDVWNLFERLLERAGPRPTLVEWDNDIPDWAILEGEVKKADEILSRNRVKAA